MNNRVRVVGRIRENSTVDEEVQQSSAVRVEVNKNTGTAASEEVYKAVINIQNQLSEIQSDVNIMDKRLNSFEKNNMYIQIGKLAKISRITISVIIPIFIISFILMGSYFVYKIDDSKFLKWFFGVSGFVNAIGYLVLLLNSRKN